MQILSIPLLVLAMLDPAPAPQPGPNEPLVPTPESVEAPALQDPGAATEEDPGPDPAELLRAREAALLIGLDFSDEELELLLDDLAEQLQSYAALRAVPIANELAPTGSFTPLIPGIEPNQHQVLGPDTSFDDWRARMPGGARPLVIEQGWRERWQWLSITELGFLLRSGELTCVELLTLQLARLRHLDHELECVITFLPERALGQALLLDRELAAGIDRGPLHGIPWGAKDLLSVAGAPTTWGAKPFEGQLLERDAEVVRRLDQEGAVLIAKLSLGALAWGDVWFDGVTKNPWDTRQGSSGSSAGPASAVAAGGVVFAIGSETLGSIVSPSVRCGVSSIRPTFGRVSRDGAMALSWSMDKLGPMARSIEDAWLVQYRISGPSHLAPRRAVPGESAVLEPERDPGVLDVPLHAPGQHDLRKLRIGVPRGAFDGWGERIAFTLDSLRADGHEIVEVDLPDQPVGAMLITLSVEAAAAFDELTRSGADDQLVRQVRQAWPNVFRAARLIPAVEYIQAQRLRAQLMRELHALMGEVDLLVHPPYEGGVLSMTNLTGHPTLTMPVFLEDRETPVALCLTGRLFDEGFLVGVAQRWQAATGFHLRHPEPTGPGEDELEDEGDDSEQADASGS